MPAPFDDLKQDLKLLLPSDLVDALIDLLEYYEQIAEQTDALILKKQELRRILREQKQ